MALLSANVIVCETVLAEKTDVLSAIRIMNVITIPLGNNSVRFFVVTFLTCESGDYSPHTLKVQTSSQDGLLIADAPDFRFTYGYKADPSGPGGFSLTTAFNLDVSQFKMPLNCLISSFLDGVSVARTPLMLLRRS